MRVYCERGAYLPKLSSLERAGAIELVHFPYEGNNRKVIRHASPSIVTADCTCIAADGLITVDQYAESPKITAIREIVGFQNEFDVRHLDSAYKTGCKCFLTPDKRDIVVHSKALEALLGLRVFHRMALT
jgi:hypothetical protein